MQSSQSVHVVHLFVAEREASLRRTLITGSRPPTRRGRRWLGRQLVSLGTWVAAEPATQPALAR